MKTSWQLQGKKALVTGSSRGIGRAIAELLASRGAEVVVNWHKNAAAADDVVAEITAAGGRAVAIQADVSVPSEITRLFHESEAALGKLDIVVANAGTAVIKSVTDSDENDYEETFGTNTKGVFFVLKAAARRLHDNGRIIVISTGVTRMWFTETSLYLGSKGAVEQFVRALSRELGPRRITVNAVLPGFTNTDLLPERDRAKAAEMSPFGCIGEPKDVAEVVAFLASEPARWVTGQNIGAGGGVM